MCHDGIIASCRLMKLAESFENKPIARPFCIPVHECTTNELQTLVMSRAWRAASREFRVHEPGATPLTTHERARVLASLLQLFSELTPIGRKSRSNSVILKGSASNSSAEMHFAKQTQKYFSLLAAYLKKFPTAAIVAFLKTSLPSCGITLDCGPEKIEGGRRYIILAAIGVATGAPEALCQSLILLKPTQREGRCAFRTLLSSVSDNMPTGKQTQDEYNTYGGDAIELHPGTFQVRYRCGLSSLVSPCLLPHPCIPY